MNSKQEIVILLKALKILRLQAHKALTADDVQAATLLDLLNRSNNLNYCLEQACWSIFGQRNSDSMKHLLDQSTDLG